VLALLTLWACQGPQKATIDSGEEPTAALVDGVTSTLDEDYETLLTVSWQQGAAATVWVEYFVDEGDWMRSPARDVEAGAVSQILLGLPYEHGVTFRIANDFGSGPLYAASLEDHTGLHPYGFPEAELVTAEVEQLDPGASHVFLSVNGDQGIFTFIIDRKGRAVWARQNPPNTVSLHPRISQDGTQLLIDESTFWSVFDGGAGSRVRRMHIDGTEVALVETPGLHHPFTELPDGSLAWPANDGYNELLQIRPPGGEIETLFSCNPFLRAHGFDDYCGSNTLWFDAEHNRFLYSLYSAETILEIDRDSGEVLRHFGHIDGAWSFAPEDGAFWWQHGGYLTADGNLLVSSKDADGGTETVIREYALDEGAETLELVWSFGVGAGIYGDVMGEAHRLAGGNTLHNYGSATRLREVTPEGSVVWDVRWDRDTMGRSEPIADLYALLP